MENGPSKINRVLLLFLVSSLLLNVYLIVFISKHFQITVALNPQVPALLTPGPAVNAEPVVPVVPSQDTPEVRSHKAQKIPAEGARAFLPASETSSRLSWAIQAPMPTARDRFAAGEVNGVLYYVGGQNMTGDRVTAVEAYHPGTNSWSTEAPLPAGREDLGVAVVDGTLYAIGGFDGAHVYDQVEAYHPGRNTWSEMAPMPTARCNLGVGVVNGVIYAVGGDNASGMPLPTVEAYHPDTNSWKAMADMPTARSQLTVGVVNGILYAAGGGVGTGFLLDGSRVTDVLEAFNPETNSWTTGLAPEPTGVECALGAVGKGSFFVVGGCSTTDIVNLVESYDPGANRWTVESPLPATRCAQAGAEWNGVIYSVGGWGSGFSAQNQAGTLH